MDFHILKLHTSKHGDPVEDQVKSATCVFHYNVPDAVNAVGKNWRDIIVIDARKDDQGVVRSSVPVTHQTPDELGLMATGAIAEEQHDVIFTVDVATSLERKQEISDSYVVKNAEFQARILSVYKCSGYAANVV